MYTLTDPHPQFWLRRYLKIKLHKSLFLTIPTKVILSYYVWSIWIGRNKCTFEGLQFQIKLAFVLSLATKFWFLAGKTKPAKHVIPMYVKWKPLAHDFTMLNIDGTFNLGIDHAFIAGVFRNYNET